MKRRDILASLVAAPAAFAAGCGYKRVDAGSGLAANAKTIAIPTFGNPSLRYKIEQRFTDAVTREILRARPKLRVIDSQSDADLVLTGEIKDFRSGGALLDDTGRTRVYQVVVVAGVTLRERETEKVLFDNQRMVFRGEYELAGDPDSFFNEEDPAAERLARDFAASVVSTILTGSF